jgi:hypothetical protein
VLHHAQFADYFVNELHDQLVGEFNVILKHFIRHTLAALPECKRFWTLTATQHSGDIQFSIQACDPLIRGAEALINDLFAFIAEGMTFPDDIWRS